MKPTVPIIQILNSITLHVCIKHYHNTRLVEMPLNNIPGCVSYTKRELLNKVESNTA